MITAVKEIPKYTCVTCNGLMPDIAPIVTGIFEDYRKYIPSFDKDSTINNIFVATKEDMLNFMTKNQSEVLWMLRKLLKTFIKEQKNKVNVLTRENKLLRKPDVDEFSSLV